MNSKGVITLATDKRQFTLRMQEQNFLKIKHIAETQKRSIAMQIEYLVEEHIKTYESEHGKIILPDE